MGTKKLVGNFWSTPIFFVGAKTLRHMSEIIQNLLSYSPRYGDAQVFCQGFTEIQRAVTEQLRNFCGPKNLKSEIIQILLLHSP